MDHGPLVNEEIDAGARLIREFDRYGPVKAAFWLRASDEDERYLYLASDRIDDTNLDLAYRDLVRLVGEINSPDLYLFRIKLIPGSHRLARAALEMSGYHPKERATRFGGRSFGDLFVADGYLYPATLTAAAS